MTGTRIRLRTNRDLATFQFGTLPVSLSPIIRSASSAIGSRPYKSFHKYENLFWWRYTARVEIFVVTIFRGFNFHVDKFSWVRVAHRKLLLLFVRTNFRVYKFSWVLLAHEN